MSIHKEMVKEIKQLFQGTGISISSDNGESYFNFSKESGLNCEFYVCGNSGYLSSRYTVDGKETELDLHYLDDGNQLISVVKKILKVSRKDKITKRKGYPKLKLVS